jgi:hypothetical protein
MLLVGAPLKLGRKERCVPKLLRGTLRLIVALNHGLIHARARYTTRWVFKYVQRGTLLVLADDAL